MPRVGREQSGTGIYHVMLRGINRQDIFEEPEDYWTFIRILSAVHECPTISSSICGKTMKNNDSKFNQTCPSDWPNYYDPGTYYKNYGTQPENRFQLKGKTWTAPAPNNLKYNLINVRRNIRWESYF